MSLPFNTVLVCGTHPKCGKTTLTAGLAATLTQAGHRVLALKPLEFLHPTAFHAGIDQRFLNQVSQQLLNTPTLTLEGPQQVSTLYWQRILESCSRLPYPTLLEAPGSVASPMKANISGYQEVIHFAQHLQAPVLLVTEKTSQWYAQTVPTLAYLQQNQIETLGFVCVETQPQETLVLESEYWQVSQRFQLPFLGELPYSPSISVDSLHQGNLIRLTEEAIDLLPLVRVIQNTLP